MALAYEQPTAGSQQPGHHAGPLPHVGKPAQRADTGVHEIEVRRGQDVERVVDVRLHVLDGRARQFRQSPRLGNRRAGEIEAGHRRTQSGERDGVGTDVALQVHRSQAADVAEARQVEPDDVTEEVAISDEVVEGVVG